VDGECPRGHTIVRCPNCGSILQEGVCPKGCNADPLSLAWPGSTEWKCGTLALQIVSSPKPEWQGFTLRVPPAFVLGPGSIAAGEPLVSLTTIANQRKAEAPAQCLRFELDETAGVFKVTLLISPPHPAFVNGIRLGTQGETAMLPVGGYLDLVPGVVLQLVEAPEEPDPPSI